MLCEAAPSYYGKGKLGPALRLDGTDRKQFCPILPKELEFEPPLPSPALLAEYTKLPVFATVEPTTMITAVGAARADDRKAIQEGKETLQSVALKRYQYDPLTESVSRPRKRHKADSGTAALPKPGLQESSVTSGDSSIQVGEFALVQEIEPTREESPDNLYLAKVVQVGPPHTLHLWAINKNRKITPQYNRVGDLSDEWWRGMVKDGLKEPPEGYEPWDIDTEGWRILLHAPVMTQEMTERLLRDRGNFSFYK